MIEECHASAWLGGAREQFGEERGRQALPERLVTGRTEAQAVTLLTINGILVPLEDLDVDAVCGSPWARHNPPVPAPTINTLSGWGKLRPFLAACIRYGGAAS